MEAKFTRGEWVADVRVGCCAVYAASSRDEWEQGLHDDDRNFFYASYPNVAMNPTYEYQSCESIANAHLIAAAPDMYEMLEILTHTCRLMASKTPLKSEFEALQAGIEQVLSKARGE